MKIANLTCRNAVHCEVVDQLFLSYDAVRKLGGSWSGVLVNELYLVVYRVKTGKSIVSC